MDIISSDNIAHIINKWILKLALQGQYEYSICLISVMKLCYGFQRISDVVRLDSF